MPDGHAVPEEQADRLLAATIYLMTCHGRNGCPRLAFMIEKHLQAIGRLAEASERVRDTCQRLAAAWKAIREHDAQALEESVAEGGKRLH